jgi:uncharacterized membrane protein YhaH (DUF805 family)
MNLLMLVFPHLQFYPITCIIAMLLATASWESINKEQRTGNKEKKEKNE